MCNHRIQLGLSHCVPACTQMVLHWFRKPEPSQRVLSAEMGTTLTGGTDMEALKVSLSRRGISAWYPDHMVAQGEPQQSQIPVATVRRLIVGQQDVHLVLVGSGCLFPPALPVHVSTQHEKHVRIVREAVKDRRSFVSPACLSGAGKESEALYRHTKTSNTNSKKGTFLLCIDRSRFAIVSSTTMAVVFRNEDKTDIPSCFLPGAGLGGGWAASRGAEARAVIRARDRPA